jgi:hypothetical protein
MASLDDITGAASLREESVRICVAGNLNAEHERLVAELGQVDGPWEPTRMGDVDPRQALAQRIRDVEEEMGKAEFEFRFRALAHQTFRVLLDEHTDKAGNRDVQTLLPALIVACCVDPAIPDLQAWQRLDAVITQGQFDELSGAAWRVNTGSADVPKSVRASVLTATSERG